MSNPHDLMKVDVSKFVEKKNGLSYLSWSHAWAHALKHDPSANFNVESWTDDQGNTRCWMPVNGTAMVWVTVTMFGQPRTCMLPVMNSRNEPISIEGRKYKDKYGNDRIEKVDAFNLNTAIMRCMTKALALHGLGLNIYAGEDLPLDVGFEKEEEQKKDESKPGEASSNSEEVEDDPNDLLFAESMVEYIGINTTKAGLLSYWKANEVKLEELNRRNPKLFNRIKASFTEMKDKIAKGKKDDKDGAEKGDKSAD